jgi:hypothetical protein
LIAIGLAGLAGLILVAIHRSKSGAQLGRVGLRVVRYEFLSTTPPHQIGGKVGLIMGQMARPDTGARTDTDQYFEATLIRHTRGWQAKYVIVGVAENAETTSEIFSRRRDAEAWLDQHAQDSGFVAYALIVKRPRCSRPEQGLPPSVRVS